MGAEIVDLLLGNADLKLLSQSEASESPWLHTAQERVGEAGLEPATSASRTQRATKLRYSPKKSSCELAEGEGFEPPEPFDSADFESAALDQTMRPLRPRCTGRTSSGVSDSTSGVVF